MKSELNVFFAFIVFVNLVLSIVLYFTTMQLIPLDDNHIAISVPSLSSQLFTRPPPGYITIPICLLFEADAEYSIKAGVEISLIALFESDKVYWLYS